MNTLIFFVAGISVGLVADKLYRTFIGGSRHTCCDEEESEKDSVDAESVAVESVDKKEDLPGESVTQAEVRRDDLTQLKGVGPKLADALDDIGIYNYEQLSSSSADVLLERLKETGRRFSLAVLSTVVERAGQAVEVS